MRCEGYELKYGCGVKGASSGYEYDAKGMSSSYGCDEGVRDQVMSAM